MRTPLVRVWCWRVQHYRIFPNLEHGLSDNRTLVSNTITHFMRRVFSGTPRPTYAWSIADSGLVDLVTPITDVPQTVNFWYANTVDGNSMRDWRRWVCPDECPNREWHWRRSIIVAFTCLLRPAPHLRCAVCGISLVSLCSRKSDIASCAVGARQLSSAIDRQCHSLPLLRAVHSAQPGMGCVSCTLCTRSMRASMCHVRVALTVPVHLIVCMFPPLQLHPRGHLV